MQARFSTMAAGALGVALAMTTVKAADPAAAHLGPSASTASWNGAQFVAATNVGGSVDESSKAGCFDANGRPLASPLTTGPDACDVFTISVDVAPSYWSDRSGGVTVRLEMNSAADDFDLEIYRRNADGTRGAYVIGSGNQVGEGEQAFIDRASGGYYVVAIGFSVTASSYRGTASFDAVSTSDLAVGYGRSVASYLFNVSPSDPGITVNNSIVEQHRIPAPDDGVLLDTWVVRPPVPEPVPIVIKPTPYHGGGSPITGANTHLLGRAANELVPRGYAYVLYSIRGTGNSEGCFSIGGKSEARDTAAVIEYYAAQAWSNGRVGMMGASYDGTAPQDVWVEAPPSLKTIVPVAAISDLYKYNFVNGVPIVIQGFAFNTYYWGLVGLSPVGQGGGDQLRDPVSVPGAIAGEVCAEQVWVQEGGVSSTIDGNKDGYWLERDFLAELRETPNRARASVFYIHGLGDWNVKPHNMEDWLQAVQATGVPFKAWLGQWAHAYPDRADWWGDEAAGVPSAMVAWFDQFLKQRKTGILNAPAVQVKTDLGAWRHEADWPPQAVTTLTYYPKANGKLTKKPGAGAVSYYDYLGTAEGPDPIHGPDRVVFVSAPLEDDLHLSGMPRFKGTVTASGNKASLMLTLAERTPSGDRPINWAAISLNHIDNLAQGNVSIANRPQKVKVDFFPQEDVVRKGSRLVLIASGALVLNGVAGPGLQPTGDGSTITIDVATARLVLPVDRTVTYEK